MKISTHSAKGKWKPFFCFEIYDLQQDGFVNLVFGIFGKYLKFQWHFDGYIYKYRFEYGTDFGKRNVISNQSFLEMLKLWFDIQTGKKIIIGSWLYQKVKNKNQSEAVKKYWNHKETTEEQRRKSLIRINDYLYEIIDEWGIKYLNLRAEKEKCGNSSAG